MLEAERRPLVTYSSRNDAAWAAKIVNDTPYQPRPRSRVPPMAAAVAALLFIGTFFGGRAVAVSAVPDLAGLYAAIGLPVNLRGLTIEDVAAERSAPGPGVQLTVRGTIRNLTAADQAVPPLTVTLGDSAGAPLSVRGFEPPSTLLPANQSAPFILELVEAPGQAAKVVVRFRRPAEAVSPEGVDTTTP